MNQKFFLTGCLACALVGVGCGDEEPMPMGSGDAGVTGSSSALTFDFDGLPVLGDGYVYEGWLVVDMSMPPVTTGRFTVDDAGVASPASFELDRSLVESAAMFVLTIEPEVGDDPAPSDTHVLAGPLEGTRAALTVEHPAALGDDFTSATGELILATPTSAAMDDEGQGIWFLVPPATAGGMMTAGLDLPTLPAGWEYEGWVVADGTPVSTGRFTDPAAADSDGAGDAAGDMGAPPFPGQDYVDPARDLTAGNMAVISVEPSPDDSPAPFVMKPLAGALSADLAPATQTIPNIAGSNNPSGTARFSSN